MRTWRVDSLCLAVTAIALALLVPAAYTGAWRALPPMAPAALILLAGAALLAALRLRFLSAEQQATLARLRAIQRRYLHFVDTAHEGIWVIGADTLTVFANARLAAMFGVPLDDMAACSLQSFLADNPRKSLRALTSADQASAGRTYDLCYRRADGSVGWAIVSGRPMLGENGAHESTLLMLTDISERKAAELELAAIQIGLEVRIRMRTLELERSNAQLRIEMAEREAAERALAESFRQLRQLNAHLETIKEEERKLIAKDIHDELGQNLMVLKMDVQMLHAHAGRNLPLLKRRFDDVLDTIDLTIRSVRAIINDLHPSTLELGLPAALEWLVDQFQQRSGIATRLSVRGDGPLPDGARSAALFRIIQESLLNILRHAKASQVDVGLSLGAATMSISIVDNGVGMQPDDAGKAAVFGLRGIRERVDAFGGTLLIDSEAGGGTTLSILIPLDEQELAPNPDQDVETI